MNRSVQMASLVHFRVRSSVPRLWHHSIQKWWMPRWSQLEMSTMPAPPRLTMDKFPHDYSGALAALAHYFDALHLRDPARMQQVWHPSSHLKRIDVDGGLVDIDSSRFLQIVGEATGERVAQLHLEDRVLGIDFAGPDTVLAKVEISLGATIYTHFLSLLRLREGWRVVAKLFTSRAAATTSFIDSTPPANSHGEIGVVLSEFIAACRNSDAKRLQALLHPACSTYAVRRDGTLREVGADAFVERTGAVYAALPPGEGAARYAKVVSIDKSGPNTAAAKVQTGYSLAAGQLAVDPSAGAGDYLFTNHLLLARLGGGWCVVSRTYSAEAI